MTRGLVHVVDDDDAVRAALAVLLEAAGLEVCTYASAEAFLDEPQAAPGCVVTDVQMPGISGLELLRRLADRRGQFPVVVLTGQADVPMAVAALKEGAFDFIEKPFDGERMIHAAESALARMTATHDEDGERERFAGRAAKLTAREQEVFERLVLGLSTKGVARELGVSPRTVDVYRANVMTKMEAESLAELVRMALALKPR